MDEIILSPFIHVLLGRLKSLSDLQIGMIGMQTFVGMIGTQTFVKDLEYIASMIGHVEANQTNLTTKLSLRGLQNLLFDVDDEIDKVERLSGKVDILLPRLLCPLPELMQASLFFHKLETHFASLTEIKRELTNVPSINTEKLAATVSDSLGGKPQIFGRDKEVDELLHIILADRVSDSVLPIVGLMGIGKTTLAQRLYEDSRIIDHFRVRIWVHVGRNSANSRILHARGEQYLDKEVSLSATKTQLSRLTAFGERFFLVLDDCWDKASCESLLRAVINSNECSASVIIVTTHSTSLASALGTLPAYQLRGLSSDASYLMLTEKAIQSRNFQNDLAGFEDTAREIVKLCRGVPQILRIVGAHLCTISTAAELESVLARLEYGSFDEITETFTFYYDMLPSHLKLPFQTFFLQKACGLSVDTFTCLWMALGFLYPPDTYHQLSTHDPTQLVAIGREYLREFAESDLSLDVQYAPGGVIREINMDDHMYGVCISKARSQWVMIRDLLSQRIDETVRYIIWVEDPLSITAVPSQLLKAKKARLFILHTQGQASDLLVMHIINSFESLRVLGLGGCDIKMLPSFIGKLKHLRYLDVGRNARLKRLPNSIFGLLYLQTLLLHGCDQLEKVPAGIGRLRKLMYLTLTTLQESLPKEIGKLTSLQTLALARCRRLASLPRSIKNLKGLKTLAIVDCQVLDLEADSSVEGLKGNEGIETLLLKDLPKFVNLPSDLGALSVAMKHLVIQSCILLKETMWINQLKSLRSLTIEGCPELSGLVGGTSQFNSLLELVIRRCESLCHTDWIMQFVSLRSLIIDDCRNLAALNDGFSNLKNLERLEISNCPHLTKRCAPDGEDWHLIVNVRVIQLDGESLKS